MKKKSVSEHTKKDRQGSFFGEKRKHLPPIYRDMYEYMEPNPSIAAKFTEEDRAYFARFNEMTRGRMYKDGLGPEFSDDVRRDIWRRMKKHIADFYKRKRLEYDVNDEDLQLQNGVSEWSHNGGLDQEDRIIEQIDIRSKLKVKW